MMIVLDSFYFLKPDTAIGYSVLFTGPDPVKNAGATRRIRTGDLRISRAFSMVAPFLVSFRVVNFGVLYATSLEFAILAYSSTIKVGSFRFTVTV